MSHLGDVECGVLEFTLPLSILPDWSKGKEPAWPFQDLSQPSMAAALPGEDIQPASVLVTYGGDLGSVLSLFFISVGNSELILRWIADVMTTTTNKRQALQLGIKGLHTPQQNKCQAQLQSWVTSAFVLLIAFSLACPCQANWKRALLPLDQRKLNLYERRIAQQCCFIKSNLIFKKYKLQGNSNNNSNKTAVNLCCQWYHGVSLTWCVCVSVSKLESRVHVLSHVGGVKCMVCRLLCVGELR